jgi:hypothetical protein
MSDHTSRTDARPDPAPRDPVAPVARLGSLPAGREEPPRQIPPNPQHPEIPQTHDPRVSVQLERAARDVASGVPGLAAREDLERFRPDPRLGAGPQPLPPRPTQTGVEGIPARDTVVTFNQQFASYFAGESAAFTPEEAQRLTDLGVVGEAGGGGDPNAPPVNDDVPHVTQSGDTLNCTMGNWQGTPTGYAYAWQLDGSPVGTDSATHTVTSADAGKSATCTVTATNANGSTAAPPSTAVVVTDPAGATRSGRSRS